VGLGEEVDLYSSVRGTCTLRDACVIMSLVVDVCAVTDNMLIKLWDWEKKWICTQVVKSLVKISC